MYGSTGWVQILDGSLAQEAIKIGTDMILFGQFSGAGSYLAGAGLLLTGNTFSVKTDGVTTYINGSSQVAVDSSATMYQVLVSTGTAGTTATWTSINLASSAAVGSSILNVANGGTGDASLTLDGVLYGNGTSPVGVTAAGAAGTYLAGTGGAPTFQSLASNVVTSFQTSLSGLTPSLATMGVVTLAGTLGVASGGTGDTTLTLNGVLYGNGTSPVGATAEGASGTVLTGNGASPPSFVALNTIAVTSVTGTANEITASPTVGAVTLSLPTTLIAPGSLEVTTTTKFDGLYYENTNASVAAAGTTQVTATVLTAQYNVVSTSASNVGVELPVPAYAGLEIEIVNLGSLALNIYPNTGGYIDAAAQNAAIVVPAGGTWTGKAATTTQWYSVDPVLVSGNIGITVMYGNGQTSILNAGVLSFSAGTTGLTPSSPTTGNVTLGGVLNLASGGTNANLTASAGSVVYSTASAMAFSSVGTSGYLLESGGTGAPTWVNPATNFVQSFETSLVGLTPQTATTGAVTLAGTLASTSGGTGVDNHAAASGTVLVGTSGSPATFTATPIEFVFDSSAHGGPLAYYTVNHALSQKFVTVQVYTQDTSYAATGGWTTIDGSNGNSGTFTAGDAVLATPSGTTAVVALTNADMTPLYLTTVVGTPANGDAWTDTTTPGATFSETGGAVYNTITISGNFTSVFTPGTYFVLSGTDNSNDGAYTVASSIFASGTTTIVITGTLTALADASGQVVVGPSQIIPQAIFLVDANNVVVTLNTTLNVYVIVTGVKGVVAA